jgi:hypothetical protein
MSNDLWPHGFPGEDFEQWISNCPVQWIRLEVAEGSATYKFILEEDEEEKGPFETYLLVEDCRTGREWIVEFDEDSTLDLREQVEAWIEEEFCGELKIAGELTPCLQGDYYAQIKTDWATKDSVVCWESGGFYLRESQPPF